jgi:DNA invertase Pin-like site-specific DNA recombinase
MKAAIYLRTSTKEQFPEKQKGECLILAKRNGYSIDEEDIHIEKLSAFKDIQRPEYEKIKKKASNRQIQAVIVWALDRWVRRKDTLLEDVIVLKTYGVKLHSVKESWLEAINIEGVLGKTIQDFLLGLIGSLAEMESQRKSDRMKMAYKNRTGNWGRKPIPKITKEKIIELHKKGIKIRDICNEVYYYDKNKHKKNVSSGLVHKTIAEFQEKINTQK